MMSSSSLEASSTTTTTTNLNSDCDPLFIPFLFFLLLLLSLIYSDNNYFRFSFSIYLLPVTPSSFVHLMIQVVVLDDGLKFYILLLLFLPR